MKVKGLELQVEGAYRQTDTHIAYEERSGETDRWAETQTLDTDTHTAD